MIEKIITKYPDFDDLKYTVNQLVDAVNSLRDDCNLLMENIAPENKCQPVGNFTTGGRIRIDGFDDPYAEQRKWIGKLCWFWDDEKEEKVCGILTTIDSDCRLSDMCPYWNGTTSNLFEHCEPVKPDDDIMFKGEQQ